MKTLSKLILTSVFTAPCLSPASSGAQTPLKDAYAEGQYNVGTMYYNGHGVTKSRELAIMWIKRAAAQDYAKAKKALKQLGVV